MYISPSPGTDVGMVGVTVTSRQTGSSPAARPVITPAARGLRQTRATRHVRRAPAPRDTPRHPHTSTAASGPRATPAQRKRSSVSVLKSYMTR